MIRRYGDVEQAVKSNVRGGVGDVVQRYYLAAGASRFPLEAFNLNEMQPGCTIPEHRHDDDEEFYYIVSGTGTGLLNGASFPIGPGDAFFCRQGETHGILNTTVPGQVLSFISIFFRLPA